MSTKSWRLAVTDSGNVVAKLEGIASQAIPAVDRFTTL
jgi:hypothetical protein